MRVVIPDNYPPVYQNDQPVLAPLRPFGSVEIFSTRFATPAELIERCQGARCLINVRSYAVFDVPVLDALPDLEMISILGTGTDNVDLDAATERGIVVTNTPGVSAVSVAEATIGLLFAVTRRLPLMDRRLRAGVWQHEIGPELRGRTLGVVGLGAIGSEVATLGRGLGLRVIAWSFRRDPERAARLGIELVELDDLLRQADVVSLHLRNSPQAAGLISARELALMKPTAYLINTARGAIVDQSALVDALRERRIAGAALDVFVPEPLPADSPFLTLDNVVVTPHVAAVTHEAQARLAQMPVDNIVAFLQGHPEHVVNPAVLSKRV
jgi:phosphoglycerate dehydrogenase-like enzyme